MLTRRIQGTTHTHRSRPDWPGAPYQPQTGTPARIEDGRTSMAFEPTPEELAALVAGASIVVTFFKTVVPVELSVVPAHEITVVPEGDIAIPPLPPGSQLR